jgi:PKD domain-containing protein
MINRRRKSLASLVVATAAALLIAACGGDSGKKAGTGVSDPNPDNDRFHVGATGSRFGGPSPLTVNFFSEPFHEKGTVHWRWRFDDGTTSEEQNPAHVFKRPGYYQVLMEARDATGQDAWNLIVGVWPPDVWEGSSKQTQGKLDVTSLKKLQRAQSARTSKRRREQLAKSKKRAAQYRSPSGSQL